MCELYKLLKPISFKVKEEKKLQRLNKVNKDKLSKILSFFLEQKKRHFKKIL